MKTVPNRIVGLDLIRAIAILLIMCSHSVVLVAPNSVETLPFIIKFFGTIGVDVFFVLSGFLIGSILLKQIKANKTKPKDFVYFWVRRWFRTLPNYYLLLVINIILVSVFNRIDIFSILKYSFFLQNFSTSQADFFTESWSLTIEEFAYIILPLGLLLFSLLNRKITQRLFLILTLVVIGSSVLNRLYFHYNIAENLINSNWSAALRKVMIYRLDSIYFGFIGAYIFLNFKQVWQNYKKVSFVFGSLIFLGLHVYILVSHIKPNLSSLFFNTIYLPVLSLSILLLFPLVYSISIKGILKSLITKISQWSYALYLVNYSLVLLTIKDVFQVSEVSFSGKIIVIIVFWLVSFFLSIVLFKFYEQPLLRVRDSKFILKYFKKTA